MIRLDERIAQSGFKSAEIARRAGVRPAAVSDYRARRYDKCGKTAKKKIDAVLMDLGIKKRPDPKARARRSLMQFHRDARDPRLIDSLLPDHLKTESAPVVHSQEIREEIMEGIFGVVR